MDSVERLSQQEMDETVPSSVEAEEVAAGLDASTTKPGFQSIVTIFLSSSELCFRRFISGDVIPGPELAEVTANIALFLPLQAVSNFGCCWSDYSFLCSRLADTQDVGVTTASSALG